MIPASTPSASKPQSYPACKRLCAISGASFAISGENFLRFRNDLLSLIALAAESGSLSNFAKLAGETKVSELLRGVAIASIGPITSDTIRKLGLSVTLEAKQSTIPGLVRAIEEHCKRQTDGE